jgi:hypothetical protein
MRIPQQKSTRHWVRLGARQKTGLEALARQHQTTISVLIREAIDRLREQKGAEAQARSRADAV